MAFVAVLRALLARSLSVPAPVPDVAGVLALLGLPAFFRYVNYLYDLPTLLLYTLCLLLMLRRNWPAYGIAFVLCALSKETAALLIPVYLLTFRREAGSARIFDGVLAFQVAAFVAVRASLMLVYGANPGSAVEFQLQHNLMLTPYGPGDFAAGCVFLLAVAHDWHAKPLLLRNTVLMIVPLLWLTFLFGYLDELRDYYEVYPGAVATITYSVCRLLGVPCRSVETVRSAVVASPPRMPVAVP